MDRELLLEIGVEEMPASWLPNLTAQMAERLAARLAKEALPVTMPVEAHATPRRLTACVPALVDRQEDRDETLMGPPVSASFDPEGHPTNAGLGFARKLGADFDALIQVDTPKGKYLAFERHTRGRATVDVLSDVLTGLLRDLSFPKHMHWDAQLGDDKGEFVFGRPIRWLLFLYGGRVVPYTIARLAIASSPRVQDVTSGAVTYGHRFLATSGRAGRAIKVRSFDEYQRKLGENFVILSRIERRDRILRELESHARRIGGRAVLRQHPQAEALLEEIPDLIEFPAVVAGSFDPEFLSLPAEVLTTTLIHHQHSFPVTDNEGRPMPAFLSVTNTQPTDDKAIATNAGRVVTARLRDARFFWDADRQVGLEPRLDRLETLLFHKALGTYRAKVDRIERLAGWLAEHTFGQPDQSAAASRAARLAKADLATDMVREFTELQGIMGGVYARESGEPEDVWKAIYHHYLPVAVERRAAPSAKALGAAGVTWACVSLADKLDTLVGLFMAGERPTGSRDPFGLRRAAHGVLRLLLDVEALTGRLVQPTLGDLISQAHQGYESTDDAFRADLDVFVLERLQHALEAREASRATIRSVLAVHGSTAGLSVVDVEANLAGLADFAESDQFRLLATAFKRVRNIARELGDAPAKSITELRTALHEPAEIALADEIEQRAAAVERHLGSRDYRSAYAEAAAFEPAVARFFEEVFVMTDDAALREARLHLMRRLEQLILQLGDISEIVATES
jgi:glycyl-tRNA synthetase beta chain